MNISEVLRRSICTAIRALALAACPVLAQLTQDLPFDSGSTGADGPLRFRAPALGRTGHAMAYDAARKQVVMYGGQYSDTTVFDGTNWASLFPQNRPGFQGQTLIDPAMAYDSKRQVIVLFGGNVVTGGSGSVSNETWTWDGLNWTLQKPTHSPKPRNAALMAFDAARGQIVLFGGNTGQGTLAETWLWDGSDWTSATPATAPGPTWSGPAAMAYDGTRNVTVLFGASATAGTPATKLPQEAMGRVGKSACRLTGFLAAANSRPSRTDVSGWKRFSEASPGLPILCA